MNRATPLSALLMAFAGPLIWFMHLSLLYGGATIACRNDQDDMEFQSFALGVTAIGLTLLLGYCLAHSRIFLARTAGRNANPFLDNLGLLLAILAILGVTWTASALTLGCGN